MSLRKSAVSATVWSGIRNGIQQLSTLAIFVVLARILPAEAFGLVAYANAVIALLQVIVAQGFAHALVQRETLEPEHVDTAFWTMLGLSLLLLGAVALAVGPVSAALGEPGMAPYLPWLALSMVLEALSRVQQSLLERRFRFRALAMRTLVANLSGGAVGVGMALTDHGIWSLVGQQVTIGAVGVVTLWTASPWRPRVRWSRRHFHELHRFGAPVAGTQLVRYFSRRSDRLLIGALLGTHELGLYVVAFNTVNALHQIVTRTIGSVVLPVFSRVQGDLGQARRGLYQTTQTISLVAFPAFLGMVAVAPVGIPLLLGERWSPVVPVVQLVAIFCAGQSIQGIHGAIYMALGRPGYTLALAVLGAVLTVAGVAAAAPWGITAVAAALAVRPFLTYPLELWAIHRLLRFDLGTLLGGYVVPLLGSAMVVGIVLAVERGLHHRVGAPMRLALEVLLGVGLYTGLLRWAAPARFRALVDLMRLALPARFRHERSA